MTSFKNVALFYFRRYFEVSVWILALILLGSMSPVNDHSSLCPLKSAGFSFCPGCGLGHSISWLFHGDIKASLQAHPLGVFATGVLIFRIVQLIHKMLIYKD